MHANLRVGHLSGSLLAIVFVACGLGACTTTAAKPDGGGGKGGGSGGGSGGGAGGIVGTGGGAGGAAGYATNDGILCPPPTVPLITDFAVVVPDGGTTAGDGGDDAAADAAAPATGTVHFGNAASLGGSEFFYPTTGNWPVVSDVSAGNWHLTGTLGDYSGFGLYFDNCNHVDASAYSGISFTISGATLPPGAIVTMGIGTLDDVIAASWLNTHGGAVAVDAPGRCIPTTGTTQYNQPTCGDPQMPVTITNAPATVTIHWSDFTTGKPNPAPNPANIISMYWFFPPPTGAGTATPTTYPVDITIDDLTFIP